MTERYDYQSTFDRLPSEPVELGDGWVYHGSYIRPGQEDGSVYRVTVWRRIMRK